MAYAGNCRFHGSYLNWCGECERESLAVSVVSKIKEGMDADTALESVLSESRQSKQKKDMERTRLKLEEDMKAMARSRWIEEHIPEDLKPKGPTY